MYSGTQKFYNQVGESLRSFKPDVIHVNHQILHCGYCVVAVVNHVAVVEVDHDDAPNVPGMPSMYENIKWMEISIKFLFYFFLFDGVPDHFEDVVRHVPVVIKHNSGVAVREDDRGGGDLGEVVKVEKINS